MKVTGEEQLRAVATSREEEHIQKMAELARARLLKILQKKTQTIFIGDIARIETYFGFLWGHRKPEERLTPEEKMWREKWNLLRNEILNNGNSQMRALQSELTLHDVQYVGYVYEFEVKK